MHDRSRCDCCGGPGTDWDDIYDVCGLCAYCQSLGHCGPTPEIKHTSECCHGECHIKSEIERQKARGVPRTMQMKMSPLIELLVGQQTDRGISRERMSLQVCPGYMIALQVDGKTCVAVYPAPEGKRPDGKSA